MSDDENKPLNQRLHEQTARLNWGELQRHFARGSVIVVQPDLDLVQVAVQLVQDDSDAIGRLVNAGQLRHANDEDARRWNGQDAELWAVVVAPWVVVQDTNTQH